MKQRKSLLVAIALFAFIGFQGCDKFVEVSYRTLAVSGIIYDTAMKTTADAYKQGIIKEPVKAEILLIGNVYYNSYQAAREALEAYYRAVEGKTIVDKSKAIGCIIQMVNDLAAVTKAVEAATNKPIVDADNNPVTTEQIPLAIDVKTAISVSSSTTTTK